MVLYGSQPQFPSPSSSQQSTSVQAFFFATNEQKLAIGDVCPNGIALPAEQIYPITLLVLTGTQNRRVFACDSNVVVGVVNFEYLSGKPQRPSHTTKVVGSQPSDTSSALSEVPTRAPSVAPTKLTVRKCVDDMRQLFCVTTDAWRLLTKGSLSLTAFYDRPCFNRHHRPRQWFLQRYPLNIHHSQKHHS